VVAVETELNADETLPSPRRIKKAGGKGSIPGFVVAILIAGVLLVPVLIFLVQAFFPGLFSSSQPLFSLSGFKYAITGGSLRGIIDSLFVSILAGFIATALGLAVSWILRRTDIKGKRIWSGAIWFLLLVPTYLTTEGWQRLLEPSGVLSKANINAAPIYHIFFGPVGVIFVLGMSGIPFAYLAISATLANLGGELEDAARVHSGSRIDSFKIVIPVIMPALMSAFAIVFAESMSDFGVAYTLAANAHFPIATYTLFSAIDSVPLNFQQAAAIGWLLVASAMVPIVLQRRVTKSKSYAVVGGRRRAAKIMNITGRTRVIMYAFMIVLMVLAVMVPLLGMVSASFIKGLGTNFGATSLTLSNYRRVFSLTLGGSPLRFSGYLSVLTATATIIFGAYLARILAKRDTGFFGQALDLLLIGSVALPGIVLGAGYIFSYNQPFLSNIGINLYGTSKLLFLGYLASSLPATSRILIGPLAQIQSNMAYAARVHGSKAIPAWFQTVFPILSKALLSAWSLTFAKTLLELPLSQLLYPPGSIPLSVAINKLTAGYDYGGGTAMSVLALGVALLVIGVVNGAYRIFAPEGWKKMGGMFNNEGN
ncbi:unnamed protein product, partial [Acidithrix sp. C25]